MGQDMSGSAPWMRFSKKFQKIKKILAFYLDCDKMDCACDGQDVREGGGVWLSLVERYVRDVEVAGSNPVTPTGRELNESEPQARLEFSRSRVDALSEA